MVETSAVPLEESPFCLSLADLAPTQYLSEASGGTCEREGLAAGLAAAEGAIVGVPKLREGREALSMQAAFRAPEGWSF